MAIDTKGKLRVVAAVGLGVALSFLAGHALDYFSTAFPSHSWLVKAIVGILYVPPMVYWVIAPIFRATGQPWR